MPEPPPSDAAAGRSTPSAAERDPLRRVSQYRVGRLRAEGSHDEDPGDGAQPSGGADGASEEEAARVRMANRGAWADELVRQAMARGEFDDLAYAGKPIPGLTGPQDPDWWVRGLIEREQITGVLPEALQLRKDDAALDARLDDAHDAEDVRRLVEELNVRVVAARRQLLGGPPVVTPTRDVEGEVVRWAERRRARAEAAQEERERDEARARRDADERRRSRRWWRRSG